MAGNSQQRRPPDANNVHPQRARINPRFGERNTKMRWWQRFYLYALHGVLIEISLYAIRNCLEGNNQAKALIGQSSLWTAFIFGLCSMLIEWLYFRFLFVGIPIIFRGLVYLLWIYLWEFTTGVVLRTFNACPWDFKQSENSIHNFFTWEYAPVWLIASLIFEQKIIKLLNRVELGPEPPPEPRLQDDIAMFFRGFLTDPGPGCCQGRHRCSRHAATHAKMGARGTQMGPFFAPHSQHPAVKQE